APIHGHARCRTTMDGPRARRAGTCAGLTIAVFAAGVGAAHGLVGDPPALPTASVSTIVQSATGALAPTTATVSTIVASPVAVPTTTAPSTAIQVPSTPSTPSTPTVSAPVPTSTSPLPAAPAPAPA